MRSLICFFCVLLCSLSVGLASEAGRSFRAGAAAANISPWMGISINGDFTDARGTNLHDPLHARCVVLDDGTTRLAIVVADNCLIYRETFDKAKAIIHQKSGLPTENILMSATHCHSGPAVVSVFQSEADKAYEQFLTLRLADAVLQAINNLAPAKIGWAVASEPRHVFNRRWRMQPGVINKDPFGCTNDQVRMNPAPGSRDLLEPAGPTDPQISLLAVKTIDGRPIALLANYSMHYCGGVPIGTYSADYFGAFCDRVQQLLQADRQDPPFVAILSNGTSGDCNTIHFPEPPRKPEPPFAVIRRVANDLAQKAFESYERMEFHDWAPLKSAQKEIILGVRKPSAAEVEKAKAALAGARLPSSKREIIYARETALLNDFPESVPVLLQTFRIGDLGVAAIPGEAFAEIGLELKAKSPFKPSFIIGLANGYYGYLPTPAQHRLGGYETWRARSSYLETNAAPKVVDCILELFNQLR